MTIEMKQTEIFRNWWSRLKDERARGLIMSRLDRLSYGHMGDVKSVASCVSTVAQATEYIFRKKALQLSCCFVAEKKTRKPKTLKQPGNLLKNGETYENERKTNDI